MVTSVDRRANPSSQVLAGTRKSTEQAATTGVFGPKGGGASLSNACSATVKLIITA
jgi:hypothetical protein